MSMDFFNRLATAAIESTANIRPRTRSRFEPVEENSAQEVIEPSEASLEKLRPTVSTSPATPVRESETAKVSDTKIKTLRTIAPAQSKSKEKSVHKAAPSAETVTDRSPPQAEPLTGTTDPALPAPRPAEKTQTRRPIIDVAEPARQRPTVLRPTDVDAPSPPTLQSVAPPLLPNEKEPASVIVNEKIDRSRDDRTGAGMQERVKRPVPPPDEAVVPTPAAVRPRRAIDSDRSEETEKTKRTAADLPPTIEISIGRIELRPQPSIDTKASSSPPRFQPTLSLGDYLTRRRGGER